MRLIWNVTLALSLALTGAAGCSSEDGGGGGGLVDIGQGGGGGGGGGAAGDVGGGGGPGDTGGGGGAGDSGGGGDVGPGPDAPPIDGRSLGWSGWDNATVYFVITDRFFDGDPSNNNSYGREPDGEDEVGTFHGGDLAGLTAKLEDNYFLDLGVSAIWITAPYEQVHGWVVGGGGGFKHYAYHGYFPKDWTTVDANMGTESDLETFIETAHSQGIRVVFDVVMNHVGYATAVDLDLHGIDVLTPGWETADLGNYYDFIDFDSAEFANWWGPQWVRTDLGGGYPAPGSDPLTQMVAFLPDLLTESNAADVKLPPFYASKPDTNAVERDNYRVRDYLVEWLTLWIAKYGVDGFRCDTAKHVEQGSWKELGAAAEAALRKWRADHPDKAFPDEDYADPNNPFWMTGEVFPHGVVKDDYFANGFDSLINFDFQKSAGAALSDLGSIDAVYAEYASSINSDPDFNVLSYISSHDTSLFYEKHSAGDLEDQKLAGTLLLMAPGAVQIFYGDENARPEGPKGGDNTQGTRSDYRWGDNPDVLKHWQRVGVFRKKHAAIGAGAHEKVSDAPYIFKRTLGDDVVYVAIGASGTVDLNVAGTYPDGAELHDAYTGAKVTVADGRALFEVDESGVLLVERTK